MQRARRMSLILIAAMLMTLVVPGRSSGQGQGPAQNLPGRTELRHLRTANTKVFEKPGGLEYQVYLRPVHYQDERGQWLDLQPAVQFRPDGGPFAFRTTGVPFETSFTDRPYGNQVEFRYRHGGVRFSIEDSVGTGLMGVQAAGRSLQYRRAGGEVEYRYEAGPTFLKETVVLHRAPAHHQFEFPLELDRVRLEPQPDGSLAALDADGQIAWRFAAPTATDAAGVAAPTVTQAIAERQGQPRLVLSVDPAWLADPARAYPVEVDPTIVIEPDPADGMDTYLMKVSGSTSYYSYPHGDTLGAGTGTKTVDCSGTSETQTTKKVSLLKFNLNSVPPGASIDSARLMLFAYDGGSGELSPVRRPWDERSATWKYPWTGNNPDNDLDGAAATVTMNTNAWAEFTVTTLVRQWLSGERPNHGVALKSSSPSIYVYSSDSADPTSVPHLILDVSRDLVAPGVSITSPAEGATVTSALNASVSVSDTSPGKVQRVELLADGRLVGLAQGTYSNATLTFSNLSGLGAGEHTLEARAFDRAGNLSTDTATFTLSATPVPAVLDAVGAGAGKVQLGWSPVPGGQYTYNVYRGSSDGFATSSSNRVATNLPTTTYVDTAPTTGALYFYRVTAVSAGGTEGAATRAVATVAGAEPMITVAFNGNGLDATVPQPQLRQTGYSPNFAPEPLQDEWQLETPAHTYLWNQGGSAYTSSTQGVGLVRGHLLTFDILGALNHQRQLTGMPPLDVADLRGLVTGFNLTWAGWGQGVNGSTTTYGARLRAWNAVQGTYDLETSHTSSATAALTVQPTATQGAEHLDASGRIHALVQPSYASNGSTQASITSDYAFLTVSLRSTAPQSISAAPVGNGQVLVTWSPSALAYQVHRGGSSSFTPGDASRISSNTGSSYFMDSVATGLAQGVSSHYRVLAVLPDGTAPASAAAAAAPEPGPGVWSSFPDPNNTAENLCYSSSWNPSGSSGVDLTADQITQISKRDGQLFATSCPGNYYASHAFKFDLLGAVQNQLGLSNMMVSELKSRLAAITLDLTSYGVADSTYSVTFGGWASGTWQDAAAALPFTAPQRYVVRITSPASYVDNSGMAWFGVRTAKGTSSSALYTDHVRLAVILQPTAAPTAVATDDGAVGLSWQPTGGYHVYRSTTSGSGYIRITRALATGSYLDAAVERGRTYYYKLRPVDGSGQELAASAAVSVAVPPQRVQESGLTYTGSSWYTPSSSYDSGGASRYSSSSATDSTYSTSYTFNGTGVSYIARKGCYAKVNVYIDSVLQGTYSLYNASTLYQQTIFSISGLSYGSHTIKIAYAGYVSSSCKGIHVDALDIVSLRSSPPTGVSAAVNETRTAVQWSAPSGAVGYRVYRSATSGDWYQPVTDTTVGRNLLSDNQATIETNTLGFVALGSQLSRSTSAAWQGSASLYVDIDVAAVGNGVATTLIPATPSTAYSAQARVKRACTSSSCSDTVTLSIRAYSSSGTLLTQASQAVILSDLWQVLTVDNFVVPSDAVSVDLAIQTPAVSYFYVDGLQLEKSATATAWSAGGTYVNPLVDTSANMLTANQSSAETDTTGLTARTGSTIARSVNHFWHGQASLQASASASGGGVQTSSVAISGGTTYTFSVYLRGTGTVFVQVEETDGGLTSSQNVTLSGTWQRMTVTRTTESGATGLISKIVTTGAATFYADGWQLEQRDEAAPWTLGGTTGYTVPESLSGYYVATAVFPGGAESVISGETRAYAAIGIYDVSHPAFELTGNWTQATNSASLGGTLHTAGSSGDKAVVPLSGGGFRILGAKGPGYGIMDVYRNGTKAASVDLYSATAQYRQELYRLEGLTGTSVVEFRYTGTKNASSTGTTIALDGLEVLPGDRPWFLTAQSGAGQVVLQWTGTSSASQGYHVDRATTSGGPYTRLTTTAVIGTTYTDPAPSIGTAYYYVVYGVTTGGSLTPPSNETAATPVSSRIGLDSRWPYASVAWGPVTAYVQLESGNFVVPVTDSVIPAGRLAVVLRRSYNSLDMEQRGVGLGWRLNGQQQLSVVGDSVTWTDGDGSQSTFTRLADGTYQAEPQVFATLRQLADGWEIERKEGTKHRFNTTGQMTSVSDRSGNRIDYTLDAQGRITAIAPSGGAAWTLQYDSSSALLVRITDGAGREYTYGYDGQGRLTSATDATGAITRYYYDSDSRLWKLEDPEARITTVSYGAGRVISHTDGAGRTQSFTYEAGRTIVTNAMQQTTAFLINAQGRLAQVVNAMDGRTTFTYDAAGNLQAVEDPLGRTTQFSQYDAWGNPGRLEDALGQVTQVQYDPTLHLPTQTQDPLGRIHKTEYDTAGNLKKTIAAYGTSDEQVTQHSYDSKGLLLTTIDPRGYGASDTRPYTTTYEYDSRGWLTKVTDPLNGAATMTYDSAGNLTEQTDPIGRTTRYEYDLAGRRTRIIYADGADEAYTYDRSGLLLSAKDPSGAVVRYAYEGSGLLLSQTDPLGATTAFEYDLAGRQTTIVDPRGNRTLSGYDAVGRPISVTDGEGNTTWTEYDAVGNAVRVVLPNGYAMTAEYDKLNRLVRKAIPPATTEITYDAVGNQVLVRNGNGHYTRYQYDNLNRLARVYDALNADMLGNPIAAAKYTQYTYDKAGNQTAVKDAIDHTTSYAYDVLNRLTQETNPVGDVVQYFYDAAGQQVRVIDGNGVVTLYSYDLRGNVAQIEHDNVCDEVRYEYDRAGRKVKVQDSLGTTQYQYDLAGRLLQHTDSLGHVTRYGYDGAGNLTSLMLPEGAWQHEYDRANRMVSVTDPKGLRTVYTYTPDSRRQRVDLPYGITLQNTFDPASNRLVKQVYSKVGDAEQPTITYAYDTLGNVIEQRRPGATLTGVTTVYEYDAVGRLVKSITPRAGNTYPSTYNDTMSYTYDAVGNRLSLTSVTSAGTNTDTYTYDQANRVTKVTRGSTVTQRYVYDGNGQLILIDGYDGQDNKVENVRYEYDTFGRLVKVASGTTVTTYGYDGDGRRLFRKTLDRSEVPNSTSGSSLSYGSAVYLPMRTETVYYQYSGSQVAVERDGSGLALGVVTRGIGGELITLADYDGTTNVFLTDRLGSVIRLVDSNFNRQAGYQYDDFGAVTAETESIRNDWNFAGALLDVNSGLYHLGARYYSPQDGRFITQDTYKGSLWQPWTQNLYVYTGNNPVNYVDPTGHFRVPIHYVTTAYWDASCDGMGSLNTCPVYETRPHNKLTFSDWLQVGALAGAVLAGPELIAFAGRLAGGGIAASAVAEAAAAGAWSRTDIVARIAQDGLKVSKTVADKWDVMKNGPVQAVMFAIEQGRVFNDPQKAPNMVVFFTTVIRNGKEVAVKVVYDVVNNVLMHAEAYQDPSKVLAELEKAGEILAP